MIKARSALRRGRRYVAKRVVEIWENLGKNNLWKRILKNVIATTLLVSIALIPGSKSALGKAAYLGAITTVFGHPGRRFGQLVEALILAVSGTVLGVAWSIFGVYLGSLVIEQYPPAAYAIRGVFLAIVVLFHGFLRSKTPRLFLFVLLMIIVSVVSLTSTAKSVTPVSATQTLYPILIAAGCSTLVNICIFPEFSSRFLGKTTIDTLNDTSKALENAGHYFVGRHTSTAEVEKSPKVSTDREESGHVSSRSAQEPLKETPDPKSASVYNRFKGFVRRFFADNSASSDAQHPNSQIKISLIDLTTSKAQIRKKMSICKAAQQECNFEIAVSVLPPRYMKPISVKAMKKLVANTIAIISACESKFALLGSEEDTESTRFGKGKASTGEAEDLDDNETKKTDTSTDIVLEKAELEMIKPKREIEFGDAYLLRYLLERVAKPYEDLHSVIARTIEVVCAAIAYAYDVPMLPSGVRVPKGIQIEELDVYMESMKQALLQFDTDTVSAIEGAATIEEIEGKEPDVMPRDEIFLMASFMLNVRQAATHIEEMLKESRELVQHRQQRHGRQRIYAPHIRWSNWLYTGGDEDEALPTTGRQSKRRGTVDENAEDNDDDDAESLKSRKSLLARRKEKDVEKNDDPAIELGQLNTSSDRRGVTEAIGTFGGANSHGSANDFGHSSVNKCLTSRDPGNIKNKDQHLSRSLRIRGQAADALEWIQNSEDVLYAVKLGVAVFLVLWPAFIASWNTWYSLNRGLWAALQLILITEVSIGTSVMTFFLRGIGTTLGAIWGWAALEAHNGNRFVVAVMICIGLFPCAYVQLGTKYPKAGMVCIISICVVALSKELDTVPGTATEDYLKRWIAFMIGGTVALIVELVLLPVKARQRLVDSLAAALQQINEMEECIAAGIESGVTINVYAPENFLRFDHASSKANIALGAAETFLPFCSHEPRIKGSFEGLSLVYGELIFVLHQIVDRMENMLQLRTAYGSGPLEELNAEIYPYRRNVAGSITLTLFAIHSALTTKLPLPQYLPSARLAQLRMINRVREVVLASVSDGQDLNHKLARQRAVRRKYMSWNAASAAQAEIIEFLEELIDLTKLLVGANEFKSGLLTRPTYRDYVGNKDEAKDEKGADEVEARDEPREGLVTMGGMVRRRRGTTVTRARTASETESVPASLMRIQSRKIEAGVIRQRTNESWGQQSR